MGGTLFAKNMAPIFFMVPNLEFNGNFHIYDYHHIFNEIIKLIRNEKNNLFLTLLLLGEFSKRNFEHKGTIMKIGCLKTFFFTLNFKQDEGQRRKMERERENILKPKYFCITFGPIERSSRLRFLSCKSFVYRGDTTLRYKYIVKLSLLSFSERQLTL